jgi:hypothetical protein
MIGPKKFSEIRQQLSRALDSATDDPIAWLESRVTKSTRHRKDGGAVLQSLRRVLEAAPKRSPRSRIASKK